MRIPLFFSWKSSRRRLRAQRGKGTLLDTSEAAIWTKALAPWVKLPVPLHWVLPQGPGLLTLLWVWGRTDKSA